MGDEDVCAGDGGRNCKTEHTSKLYDMYNRFNF